jgi:Protein of unknown function (DUF5131)
MSGLFGDFVPDDMIDRVFAVMALCPHLQFQVLTKRPERMQAYCSTLDLRRLVEAAPDDMPLKDGVHCATLRLPLPNVSLGVSAEDQDTAAQRIPKLLATPAAVRIASLEPLLRPIDLAHLAVTKPDAMTVFRTINALTGRRGHGSKFGYTDACDPLGPHLDQVIVGGRERPSRAADACRLGEIAAGSVP